VQLGFFADHVMHRSTVRTKGSMSEIGKAFEASASKMISFGRR